MLNQQIENKYQALLDILQQKCQEGALVCFSGGVDSSLVLAAAKRAGISPLLAITFTTPTTSSCDSQAAKETAKEIGVKILLTNINTLGISEVARNSRARCYHCKMALFGKAREIAKTLNISTVLDGSNIEDMQIFRPGNQAAEELQVLRPLAEASLEKAEIRILAKELGLSNHDRPSSPCLASRFPYDTNLTEERLRLVEQGEQILHAAGLNQCRLRIHDDICRVEVPPPMMPLLLEQRELLSDKLHQLGFRYITLDLDGFISGKFDY